MSGEDCPFCWGTGWITVMEPGGTYDSRPVKRPCPEGCLAPEEVPF